MNSDGPYPKTTNALWALDDAILDIETGMGLLATLCTMVKHSIHPGITVAHLDYLAEQVEQQVFEVRRTNEEVWRAWRQERDPEKFARLVEAGVFTPCGDITTGESQPTA